MTKIPIHEALQEILLLTGLNKRVVGKYLGVSQHAVHVRSCSPGSRVSQPQADNIRKLHTIVQRCVAELVAENSFLQESGEKPNRKWVRSRLKDSDQLLQFRRELIQTNIHGDFAFDQKIDVIRE